MLQADLQHRISRFYHRWHALEQRLGADNGVILDFDFCPREALVDLEPAFEDRIDALDALERLRAEVESAREEVFVNRTFVQHKLEGAAAYLRARMGERWSIDAYVRATMGFTPALTPLTLLESTRERLVTGLASLGVPFSADARDAFDAVMLHPAMDQFEHLLRGEVATHVMPLRSALGLTAEPRFEVEVVAEDAYWANWIDGGVEQGIRLRANISPRIRYLRGAELNLALHEIGGHALHVLELQASAARGALDTASLNFTVHSCEAFHMEGLAQSCLELFVPPEQVPVTAQLSQLLTAYHSMVLNDAHLELESGRPIDEVVRRCMVQAPFLHRLKVLSDLRDRSRQPLFRSYIFVYAPSRALFLRALTLDAAGRHDFLSMAYRSLHTPSQLTQWLDARQAGPAC